MAGLDEPHPTGLGEMAVLDDHRAFADAIAERFFRRGRHRGGRLAGSNDDELPPRMEIEAVESAQREGADVTGSQGRVEDGPCCGARDQRTSFWRREPASISRSSVFGKQNRIFVRPSSP